MPLGTDGVRISIRPTKAKGPPRYDVVLDETGEILVRSGRDPEHETARVLQGRGLSGCMLTFMNGKPSMTLDIGKAADLSVSDGGSSLRVVRWRPFDRDAVSANTGESGNGADEDAAV